MADGLSAPVSALLALLSRGLLREPRLTRGINSNHWEHLQFNGGRLLGEQSGRQPARVALLRGEKESGGETLANDRRFWRLVAAYIAKPAPRKSRDLNRVYGNALNYRHTRRLEGRPFLYRSRTRWHIRGGPRMGVRCTDTGSHLECGFLDKHKNTTLRAKYFLCSRIGGACVSIGLVNI